MHNSDAVLDEATERCNDIRKVMTRLVRSAMASDTNGHGRGHHDDHPLEAKTVRYNRPALASTAASVLPITDSIQIAAAEVDRVAHELHHLVGESVRCLIQRQQAEIDTLRQASIMNILQEGQEQSQDRQDRMESMDRSNALRLFRAISSAPTNDEEDTRDCSAEAANARHGSRTAAWLQSECSSRAEDHVAASSLWNGFVPTTSAIVLKQMQRPVVSSDKKAVLELSAVTDHHHEHDEMSSCVASINEAPFSPSSSSQASRRRPASGGSGVTLELRDAKRLSTAIASPNTGDRPTSATSSQSRRSSNTRPGSGRLSVSHVVRPPFPYAFTPYPQNTPASWWHRVVHHLQCGRGTTVLKIEGQRLGHETVEAMLAETVYEPAALSSFVNTALSMLPEDVIIFVIEKMSKTSTQHHWREEATALQSQRVARGSPILAARKTGMSRILLSDKFQFTVDRPQQVGILEWLYSDAHGDHQDSESGILLRSQLRTMTSGPPIDSRHMDTLNLVPKRKGQATKYFACGADVTNAQLEDQAGAEGGASGDGDVYALIDVSPHIICPLSYAICSVHPFHAGEAPRNWVLEGSADSGATWTILVEHVNDNTLGRGSDFAIFDIPPVSVTQPITLAPAALKRRPTSSSQTNRSMSIDASAAQQTHHSSPQTAAVSVLTTRFCGSTFRIRLTGPCALGSHNLQISALEFYGRVLAIGRASGSGPKEAADEEPITSASVFGCESAATQSSFVPKKLPSGLHPFGPLPVPPAAKGGGKGKKK